MRLTRILLTLVVAVVLLAVAAVVVDRVAVHRTESELAKQVTQEADATGVDVSIDGFPYLTQVAAGSLDDVTLDAQAAAFGGVAVRDVHAVGHGVATSSPHVVHDATVDVLVPTATVQKQVDATSSTPVTLTAESDGLHAHVKVLGVDASIVVQPKVSGDSLTVDVTGATAAGLHLSASSLPAAIREQVSGISVPLDLPDGVTLTGAQVVAGDDGGVRVRAKATDVPLEDLARS